MLKRLAMIGAILSLSLSPLLASAAVITGEIKHCPLKAHCESSDLTSCYVYEDTGEWKPFSSLNPTHIVTPGDYSYNQAGYNPGSSNQAVCTYVTQGAHVDAVSFSRTDLKADLVPGNSWKQWIQGWMCISNNPIQCPFVLNQ